VILLTFKDYMNNC